MIGRWVVGVVLFFGVLMMMLPKTDEKSLTKIASQSMLMCTKDFRALVARQVIREEVVTVEFTNQCPDLIASLKMGERGEMVITGNKHPLKMTLNPVVENGKVRWSCRGEPAAAVTKLCRT
jgi:hypothetical protein